MKKIKVVLLFLLSLLTKTIKIQIVYLAFVVLLISVTGCLKTRSQLKNESSLDTRTINTKKSPNLINQQQKAQIDSHFYSIDRDFRELYGKIEVMEKQIDQLKKSVKDSSSSLNSKKIQKMEKQIATFEKALLSIDKKLNESVRGETEEELKPKESLKDEKDQKDTEEPSKKTNTKEEDLKDPLAKAENFFEKEDFEEAIVQYDKYRKSHPKGKDYPKATFKMGLCFQKLKMDEDAKAFYKELVQRYPKTSFAKKAQKILKSMKK